MHTSSDPAVRPTGADSVPSVPIGSSLAPSISCARAAWAQERCSGRAVRRTARHTVRNAQPGARDRRAVWAAPASARRDTSTARAARTCSVVEVASALRAVCRTARHTCTARFLAPAQTGERTQSRAPRVGAALAQHTSARRRLGRPAHAVGWVGRRAWLEGAPREFRRVQSFAIGAIPHGSSDPRSWLHASRSAAGSEDHGISGPGWRDPV